jgi:hypothetical protein
MYANSTTFLIKANVKKYLKKNVLVYTVYAKKKIA